MERADVSVVVPCYRCADMVGRAVESVVNQTVPPLELVLVDDGSNDQTLAVLKRLQMLYGADWIKIVSLNENCGVSAARNAGWDIATSDYVAFLDADDVWHPKKIEFQYSWMRDHPQIIASGHRSAVKDPAAPLNVMKMDEGFTSRYVTKREILMANPFVTPSFMLKRNIEYRFDPKRSYTEDFFLLQQIRLDGHPIAMLDVELVYVIKELGKSGASAHLWRMRRGDIKNYLDLWHSHRINFVVSIALITLSLFKFIILLTLGYKKYYSLKRLQGRLK